MLLAMNAFGLVLMFWLVTYELRRLTKAIKNLDDGQQLHFEEGMLTRKLVAKVLQALTRPHRAPRHIQVFPRTED
jgi:hypothetical protein